VARKKQKTQKKSEKGRPYCRIVMAFDLEVFDPNIDISTEDGRFFFEQGWLENRVKATLNYAQRTIFLGLYGEGRIVEAKSAVSYITEDK
jgi:hypothetical protein